MSKKGGRRNREETTSARPGESELIARYFAPLATAPGARKLIDDAASLGLEPGRELVVTVDMVVAGVHFLSTDPPATVARKALRVNLSDLAAKAAAFIEGRPYVTPHDVKHMAPMVLRHRIAVTYAAEAEGTTPDDVVRRILDTLPTP